MTEAVHSDEPPDPDAVVAGGWSPGPWGAGDELGSYHEVTAAKRASALSLLDLTRPVGTFSLGVVLFTGYPGWGSREYRQRLAVSGMQPSPGFAGDVITDRPRGPNRMTSLEERVQLTFNLGSKINGLAHAGVGQRYYGDRLLRDLVADHGTAELDTTTWGPPLLTRGLLIDVLGAKLTADPDDAALDHTAGGDPVLRGDYRITMDDLTQAMDRQRLPEPEAGDAVLIRTGWNRLAATEPRRFLRGSPGVWLRESRWLGARRVALVGTDSWCWGNNDPTVIGGAHGACHQELLVRHGVRIGEGLSFEDLPAGVDRFVLCHNPVRATGAVSTIAPATAIANIDRPG